MVLGIFGFVDSMVMYGVVYAFITYLNNFYNPMTSMMDNLSNFQDGVVAGSRVYGSWMIQRLPWPNTPILRLRLRAVD